MRMQSQFSKQRRKVVLMAQKKLQKGSMIDSYDLDGDNEITNEELKQAKEIKENESRLRKNLAQLRMA